MNRMNFLVTRDLILSFSCYFRRELLWPEMDQLLLDGDDPTAVSTPYAATVSEYRVVFHSPEDAPLEDDNWSNANGHAVYDAQHPCRYQKIIPFGFSGDNLVA